MMFGVRRVLERCCGSKGWVVCGNSMVGALRSLGFETKIGTAEERTTTETQTTRCRGGGKTTATGVGLGLWGGEGRGANTKRKGANSCVGGGGKPKGLCDMCGKETGDVWG